MPPPPPSKKPASRQRIDDPYLQGDAIPAPEAVEKNSDTSWALFNELVERHDRKFSQTVPGSVPATLPGHLMTPSPVQSSTTPPATGAPQGGASHAPLGVDELMVEARRNNRVCPRLEDWQKLYEMLPGKQLVDGKMVPPPPISPQSWRVTSAMVKRLCLRDHLEWAASNDAVMPVLIFLRKLPEEHWLHME